ncbi:MAG TPA: imidazole glycerol phosphate synthase subunit HisF [Bacteroidales bacterium]|nr:imidazole glycerol phosphate synthase subunit HisF [Bacteroidales bacterium]
MLKKRIIPCLDIRDGRTVKGINFLSLRDAGDPVELAGRYVEEGADELVFLDITATIEKRTTLADLVKRVAASVNIPFTVGGGVGSVADVAVLLKAGADKISINSPAIRNPGLITSLSREFGSQCVVVAIDTAFIDGSWRVFSEGGRTITELTAVQWAAAAEELGAGEILLTSMNSDGTRDGFAIELTDAVCKAVNIPVIASGGAGTMKHFSDLFKKTEAGAALAASVFHYGEISVRDLKNYLKTENIQLR